MEVGYIGLGAMGGALARRLLLARKLHVFDLSEARLAEFADLGAQPCESPAAVGRACGITMICVPRSADVRRILFGRDGLAEGLEPGRIVVDQTSGDPTETRRMAAELRERGVAMIDAPVSGGPRGAAAGGIAIMAGGAEEDMARARPVFEDISPNLTHCGEIGAGQVMKLINNMISACNRFAMLEGVAMGVKNGLDLATMAQVLNAGGARSKSSEILLPAIARGEASSTFALALMLKDLNLATALGMESGAPLQFGQLARGMLQTASNAFGPAANIDDIADLVATQAGISFRS